MNKVMIAMLAGVAAGILLAPDKGSVTRKKLNDGFDNLADKLNSLVEKFSPENDAPAVEASVATKLSGGV